MSYGSSAIDQPGSAVTTAAGALTLRPRTWLLPSILAAVVLFLPFGLVAVFYALRAQAAQSAGEEAAMIASAAVARRWFVATLVVGVLLDMALVSALLLLGAGA